MIRELQQSIAREPSAPSFSVPAYQSTPAVPGPAPGPTPAPRTVFVRWRNTHTHTRITEATPVAPPSLAVGWRGSLWLRPLRTSNPPTSPAARQPGLPRPPLLPRRRPPPLPLCHPLDLLPTTHRPWPRPPRPKDPHTPPTRDTQGRFVGHTVGGRELSISFNCV